MRKTISGFTIVELVVVITVLGILASIAIVSYSGSQKRAQNTSRVSELKAWQKSFVQYKATNGVYPDVPDGGYCLGTGFPSQKCRDYTLPLGAMTYGEAGSASLMTLLSTYDPPKSSTRVPVNGTVGPYVEYYSAIIHLTSVLDGSAADCPAGTYYVWGDGAGRILCRINLDR